VENISKEAQLAWLALALTPATVFHRFLHLNDEHSTLARIPNLPSRGNRAETSLRFRETVRLELQRKTWFTAGRESNASGTASIFNKMWRSEDSGETEARRGNPTG
jgi:hypothetical protein